MEERREYKRSPIELAASYGIPDADDITRDASVVNISGNGFCFETTQHVKENEQIKLKIDFAKGDTITLSGKVAWIKTIAGGKSYMVGMEVFTERGEDYERFMEFYNRKSSGKSE